MKKVLGLTVFLILCLGAPGGVERAWGQSGPIKIGFVGNLSTPWGISSKAAALMAMEEMNNAGGILGRKLQLIIKIPRAKFPSV